MLRSIYKRYLSLLLLLTLAACGKSPPSLEQIKAEIRENYPQVAHLSTQTLAQWLNNAHKPLLLDIRETAEYQVSHIIGAQLVTPNTPIEQVKALANRDKKTKIVVYCAVGVRSAQFAEKLQQAGYTNVYNLEGSIFQWANENRPLYQGEQQVQVVHPYNKFWGKLLLPQHRYKQ